MNSQPAVKSQPSKVSQNWMDEYERKLRGAVVGSRFEVERKGKILVVTMPVDSSFNRDRPHMLLPATLGPISQVAKLLETDEGIAVVVLGHADNRGNIEANYQLSEQRARAVTSIFRLSGFKQNRLQVLGVGPNLPKADNNTVAGRSLNRRVEIVLTPCDTMAGLVASYQPSQK